MSQGVPNWLIGCGIGCGAIVLILIALGVGGALFVRETVSGFEDAVEAGKTLDERYGRIGEFTPAPDGAVPGQRMRAFLAVRDFTMPQRERVAESFKAIPMSDEKARELENMPLSQKLRSIFRITGSAIGLAGRLGDLFAARNKAMLEQEMGFGEYAYIYILAYNSWLKHDPEDGPGEEHGREFGRISRNVNRHLLTMLRNQLAALPEDPPPSPGAEWKAALESEIEAMEADSSRLPWQADLPEAIRLSLEPYREALEAVYNPVTNPFELVRNKKRGSYSYTVD